MSGAVCDCGAGAPWPCTEPGGTCAWYPDEESEENEESEESDN